MLHSTTTLFTLTLPLALLTALPSSSLAHSALSDHLDPAPPPSFIELPLVQQHHTTTRRGSTLDKSKKQQHVKRTPSWLADNLVNIKTLVKEDEVVTTADVVGALNSDSTSDDDDKDGAVPLLKARIADLSTFDWIKKRVSSKWSQKGPSAPNEDNEAFKRANKRPLIPVNVELDTPSSSSSGFKKVIKRQDDQAAAVASQPTLAKSRTGAVNGKIKIANVPLIDDVVAREDIEVSSSILFVLVLLVCAGIPHRGRSSEWRRLDADYMLALVSPHRRYFTVHGYRQVSN